MAATNNPMTTKDTANPAARTTGPNFRSEAAAPRTMGSIGSTHGDRIDSMPAMKDSARVPVVIGEALRRSETIALRRTAFCFPVLHQNRVAQGRGWSAMQSSQHFVQQGG